MDTPRYSRTSLASRRFLPRLVAELPSQDLAHIRFGQFRPELHVARTFVTRQLLAAMGEQRVSSQRWILLDHEQFDRLTRFHIRYADCGALQDSRMHRHHRFD